MKTIRFLLILGALFSCAHLDLAVAEDTDPAKTGLPALSRAWTGEDVVKASQLMTSGAIPLPKFGDPKTGPIFERLTADENLSLARNHTLPVAMRAQEILGNMLGGLNAINKLYMQAAVDENHNWTREMVRLHAYILKVAALGMNLWTDFLPTIPEPDRSQRNKLVVDGLTNVLLGSEMMLRDDKNMHPEDFSLLLTTLKEAIPDFSPKLNAEVRKEMAGRFQARLEGLTAKKDKENIQSIVAVLSKPPSN